MFQHEKKKILISLCEILEIKDPIMCYLYDFKSFSDQEKIDMIKDYVDMLLYWECCNYDLYYKLQCNNKLKRAFFLACVPVAFDEIDLEKLFVDNLSTLEIIRSNLKTYAYEYPRFYLMCAVCGALDCFWEFFTPKKILCRWSQIMLNIA